MPYCPVRATGLRAVGMTGSDRIEGAPPGVRDPTAPAPIFDISDMGEAAVLLHAAETLDLRIQARIWALAGTPAAWPGVTEAIAGVGNLLVVFDPGRTDAKTVERRLRAAWQDPPQLRGTPAQHRIPVRYGGAFGPDLPELAAATGLSEVAYVERHAAGRYVVMAIGAQAGFGYLGGMDPALAVPRRTSTRAGIKAGSVMIGGAQTAVATVTSPSGWNVIGQTDAVFFDASATAPALLRLGDEVRFVEEASP